ncbi:SpdD protein [Streptomyces chrestomyceticus]|uniref:SpdD protein n=1 Tax=Streptomyces chrestomyceticus TaxID=68185 RepID=UPI001F49B3D7|nr:SpdD protein [Streptomyces chrestomyceticus]
MFLPKYPDSPTPPAHTKRIPAGSPPTRRLTPQVSVSAGAVAVVLVGGVVLTALLASIAITAASVAVSALVLRSVLGGQRRH